MKMKWFFCVPVTLSILLSCQKQANFDDVPPVAKTVSWKLTSETWTDKDGITETQGGDPCKDDDVFKYESNGDATFTRGPVVCSGSPEDPTTGKYATWKFIDGDKKIQEVYTKDFFYDNSGDVIIYNVVILTASKLVITRTLVPDIGKDPVLATYTYTSL